MKLIKRIFLCVVIFSLCIVNGCNYFNLDKCLDNGGKWNYEKSFCQK